MPAKAAPQTTHAFQPPRHKRQPDSTLPAPEISPAVPNVQQGFAFMQRTMGNQALQRMLAGSPTAPARKPPAIRQRTTGSAAQRERIQRLIGFEIETRIPWMKDDSLGVGGFEDLDYNEIEVDAGTGDGSYFGVDKIPNFSIMELVTEATDDTAKPKTFRTLAQKWVNELISLRDAADASPPPNKLDTHLGAAPNDLSFGFEVNGDKAMKNTVAVQMTHGLKLNQVESYFANMKLPMWTKNIDPQKEQAMNQTPGAVNAFMQWLEAQYDPKDSISKKSKRKEAVADLRGFFALVLQYMIVGDKNLQAYLKNKSTLFYKSKLSDVRNLMGEKNPYVQDIFASHTSIANMKAQLLVITGRAGGESVFKGDPAKSGTPQGTDSAVTIDQWLDAVLTGADDPLFEEAKNQWGEDIKPGKVDGDVAAIVEHRDLAAEVQNPPDLTQPTKLVDYLVALYTNNQEAQDLR
jgi:hypothetical protein